MYNHIHYVLSPHIPPKYRSQHGEASRTRFTVFISAFSGTGIPTNAETGSATKREIMSEGLLLIIIVAGWFILNRFILPRLGVRT